MKSKCKQTKLQHTFLKPTPCWSFQLNFFIHYKFAYIKKQMIIRRLYIGEDLLANLLIIYYDKLHFKLHTNTQCSLFNYSAFLRHDKKK